MALKSIRFSFNRNKKLVNWMCFFALIYIKNKHILQEKCAE